eukprot:m51a1_g1426 hypothetical protein (254) ;mRNA; r:68145-69593
MEHLPAFLTREMPFWPSVACSAAYLAFVVVGSRVMRGFGPVRPRFLLALHNAVLCAFSALIVALFLVSAWRTSYTTPTELVCDSKGELFQGLSRATMLAFAWSKVWEFVDTAFLVLGRSRLRFLHVYHHAVTMVFGWVVLSDRYAPSFFFALVNAFVHTPMYYYYALAAYGKSVWWKKYLTTIQITQFVLCIALAVYHGLSSYQGACGAREVTTRSAVWTSVCYTSFLVLFVQLYIENYCSRTDRSKAPAKRD